MLQFAAIICAVAAVWWVIDFVVRRILSARRGDKQGPLGAWHHFLILDVICGACYAWGACMLAAPAKCRDTVHFGLSGCEVILWVFALGSCVVLLVDLALQLRAVHLVKAPVDAA